MVRAAVRTRATAKATTSAQARNNRARGIMAAGAFLPTTDRPAANAHAIITRGGRHSPPCPPGRRAQTDTRNAAEGNRPASARPCTRHGRRMRSSPTTERAGPPVPPRAYRVCCAVGVDGRPAGAHKGGQWVTPSQAPGRLAAQCTAFRVAFVDPDRNRLVVWVCPAALPHTQHNGEGISRPGAVLQEEEAMHGSQRFCWLVASSTLYFHTHKNSTRLLIGAP